MPNREIIIIGGGIIGCTTAYYLSHHLSYSPDTTSITLLESSSIASGASGKAGGLIAKWAYPRELVPLTFSEHERLAKEHNGAERWGWRYVSCGQWEGRPGGENTVPPSHADEDLRKRDGSRTGRRAVRANLPDDLHWIREDLTGSYNAMAGDGETAQVHPYLFTTSMIELAQSRGVKVITGRATSIQYDDDDNDDLQSVSGVVYVDSSGSNQTIPATTVIVSCGPWTPSLLPEIPITAVRAHSVVIRPTRPVSAYALFTEITSPKSVLPFSQSRPEIYARPNNEVYACSPGDNEPLPQSVDLVKVNAGTCDALFEQVASISPVLRGGEVLRRQACYLPNTNAGPRGCPIVGEVQGKKGLIVAAGHTCWGICNAPGTAKALSELVMDGQATSADISRLAPKNFY